MAFPLYHFGNEGRGGEVDQKEGLFGGHKNVFNTLLGNSLWLTNKHTQSFKTFVLNWKFSMLGYSQAGEPFMTICIATEKINDTIVCLY